MQTPKRRLFHRVVSLAVLAAFITAQGLFPQSILAQGLIELPRPGTLVQPTSAQTPVLLRGIKIHPESPLNIDFIIDTGDADPAGADLDLETQRLINYFLSSLTMPEDDLWVNLSPYEKDRIVPDRLGQTDMGRDLLAQDYMLKQFSASLMYPKEAVGAEFWQKIYQEAYEKYGTTSFPINTFNKIWIVPDQARILIDGEVVFLEGFHLKVLLEQDYLALQTNQGHARHGLGNVSPEDLTKAEDLSLPVIRDVLLPRIEQEVNQGAIFANLRQIMSALVLAAWYKRNLKDNILLSDYADQTKIVGLESAEPAAPQAIYDQYLAAFQKGVFDFMQEEQDPATRKTIPRRYFSGGVKGAIADADISVEVVSSGVGQDSVWRRMARLFVGPVLIAAVALGIIQGDVLHSEPQDRDQDQAVLQEIYQPPVYKPLVTTLRDGDHRLVTQQILPWPVIEDKEVLAAIDLFLSTRSRETLLPITPAGDSTMVEALVKKLTDRVLGSFSNEQIKIIPISRMIENTLSFEGVQEALLQEMVLPIIVNRKPLAKSLLGEALTALREDLHLGGIHLEIYGRFFVALLASVADEDVLDEEVLAQIRALADDMRAFLRAEDRAEDLRAESQFSSEDATLRLVREWQAFAPDHLALLDGEAVPLVQTDGTTTTEIADGLTGDVLPLRESNVYSDAQMTIMSIANKVYDRLVVGPGLEQTWMDIAGADLQRVSYFPAEMMSREHAGEERPFRARILFGEDYFAFVTSGVWKGDGGLSTVSARKNFFQAHIFPGREAGDLSAKELDDQVGRLANLLSPQTVLLNPDFLRPQPAGENGEPQPLTIDEVKNLDFSEDWPDDAIVQPVRPPSSPVGQAAEDPVGGVDLNPNNIAWEVEGQAPTAAFAVAPSPLNGLTVDGVVPVRIQLIPGPTIPAWFSE